MSKKDYIAIAKILNRYWLMGSPRPWVQGIAKDLANYLSANNPRFDTERFLEAVKEPKQCESK